MVFIAFIIFVLCCLSIFLLFDEILRIQYKQHYSEWLRDGKPYGFFFVPKETKTFFGAPGLRSWLAMQRRCLTLNWRTPSWARQEPKVLKLIFWYRILGVISFLVWLLFAFGAIYQI